MKKILAALMLMVLTVSFAGCSLLLPEPRVKPRVIIPKPSESVDYERPIKSNIRGDYILSPSDVISVTVRGHNDLSGGMQIRPDGKITMQLIDDVEVAGLTPAQVDDLITEELKKYLKEVNVSVSVVGFNSKTIHFIGPTGNAVQLPYTGEMTVLDLVTRVGGVPQIAAPENTVIVRGDMQEPLMIKVNLKDIIYRGDPKDNILLREDDIVILPANFFSKVSMVVGNFTRGVSGPTQAVNAVRGNFSSVRSLSNELHDFFPVTSLIEGRVENDGSLNLRTN